MKNNTQRFKPMPRSFRLVLLILVFVATELVAVYAFRQQYSKILVQHATTVLKQPNTAQLAEAVSRRAVELDAYDGYGWFNYGTAVYLQTRFPEAVAIFSHGIPYLPHSYNALRLLAFSNYELKRYDDSTAQFREYLRMMPSPEVSPELIYQTAGNSALHVGDLTDANYWLLRSTVVGEELLEAYRDRIGAAVLSNRTGTATYVTRLFRLQDPEAELNPFDMLMAAIQRDKLPQATSYLETILPQSADDKSVIKALAAAYTRGGQPGRAEMIVVEAVRKDPDSPSLRLVYGDILYSQKRYGEAFAQYDEHLRLQPNSPLKADLEQKRKAVGL